MYHLSEVLELNSFSGKTCWSAVCNSDGRIWKLVGAVNDEKIQTELESAPQPRFLLHYKQLFLAEQVVPKFENMRIFTIVDETGSVVTPPDFPFAQHKKCTPIPIDVCADDCDYGCDIEWKKEKDTGRA